MCRSTRSSRSIVTRSCSRTTGRTEGRERTTARECGGSSSNSWSTSNPSGSGLHRRLRTQLGTAVVAGQQHFGGRVTTPLIIFVRRGCRRDLAIDSDIAVDLVIAITIVIEIVIEIAAVAIAIILLSTIHRNIISSSIVLIIATAPLHTNY